MHLTQGLLDVLNLNCLWNANSPLCAGCMLWTPDEVVNQLEDVWAEGIIKWNASHASPHSIPAQPCHITCISLCGDVTQSIGCVVINTRVIRGFCSYLIFPILKIKIKKVSGDSIQHRSSPGAGFSKLENTNFLFISFFSFKSESRRSGGSGEGPQRNLLNYST